MAVYVLPTPVSVPVMKMLNGSRESYAARCWPAATASIIERKIFSPSLLPRRSSHARSGWGISPKTFRCRLQIPAMFSTEPFGFADASIRPSA